MPINIVSNLETGFIPDRKETNLFCMDVEKFLDALPEEQIFDLVVTSPPYNIGKEYENQMLSGRKELLTRFTFVLRILEASAGR